MAAFFQSNNCIKYGQYTLDEEAFSGIVRPEQKPTGAILKWYNVKMTYEEKYRLGLLTYEEYIAWQTQLLEKASETPADTHFWDSDTEDRSNVSNDEYSSFLANNNIDVSNTTTLDMDALLKSIPAPSADAAPISGSGAEAIAASVSEDADLQSVLRNVTRDIHGETFLSQEEIDALFAAAGN